MCNAGQGNAEGPTLARTDSPPQDWVCVFKSTLFSASMLSSVPWSLSFLAEQIPSQLGMEQLIPEKTELTWDYIDYKSKTR